MFENLANVEERFTSLEAKLADPAVVSDIKQYTSLLKEHKNMTPIVETYRAFRKAEADLAEAKVLLDESGIDKEMKELAEEEAASAKDAMEDLAEKLKILLLPRDPNDDKNVIVEIRSGAGGEEAALFAGSLLRMYSMYAETHGFKTEVLSSNPTELGGYKEVSFEITGDGAYSRFKFESGVHRVQRVPETESQGRIQTSTATVAVLPEADEVEFEINQSDLKIDTFRSSGAGGQHINKTDSAIRITHLPTGTVVECQDERSQHKNKERALKILSARLLEVEQQKHKDEIDSARRAQVGTGDRSERIRTYNFPQGRVSDHRIGLTLYKIDAIMNGNLDELIDALITADTAAKLEAAGESKQDIQTAGKLLKDGELVAIPTETVYGLAADALNGEAVANIFKAKGRPMDNPLIVHIADLSQVDDLVAFVPPVLEDLAKAFWPGPLTVIMEKSDLIPDEVSAGLDTVAIRMPSHPDARAIIKAAGTPLAAPSANTSGMPSPTTAAHVMHDMDGKIAAVVDGGACEVGVESTVLTLCTRVPRILRPGRVTPEDLFDVLGEVDVDDAVLGQLAEGAVAASPGMKYKHYSPKAEVYIVDGTKEGFANFVNDKVAERAADEAAVAALVFDGEEDLVRCVTLPFGAEDDPLGQAEHLFDDLRRADELGVSDIYVRCPSAEGVGLAVMNRLLRAAEFRIIEVD